MAICGVGFGFFQSPKSHDPGERSVWLRRQRQWHSCRRTAGGADLRRRPGRPDLRADERLPKRDQPRARPWPCSLPPALPSPARSRAACGCSGSVEPG